MIYDLPVPPTAKGRPRVVRVQGFSRTYTPDKTVDAEERVKWHLRALGARVVAGPVELVIDFFVKMPKKPKGRYPTTRPDLDQYVKLLLDAGNGLLWVDDSQVIRITAQKVYAMGEPCIKLEVREVA